MSLAVELFSSHWNFPHFILFLLVSNAHSALVLNFWIQSRIDLHFSLPSPPTTTCATDRSCWFELACAWVPVYACFLLCRNCMIFPFTPTPPPLFFTIFRLGVFFHLKLLCSFMGERERTKVAVVERWTNQDLSDSFRHSVFRKYLEFILNCLKTWYFHVKLKSRRDGKNRK